MMSHKQLFVIFFINRTQNNGEKKIIVQRMLQMKQH